MQTITGVVARDFPSDIGVGGARSVTLSALRLWPTTGWTEERMVVFDATDILVTTPYLPIDFAHRRAYLNQVYSGAEIMFPLRIRVEGERFELESDPVAMTGRYVLIGGPFDKVWYHWLFNWCPRLLLLKWLRPEMFADPDVRFVVHPYALDPPFRDILETFGIPADRICPIGPRRDYLYESLCLVSFPDQHKLYPELIHGFAHHLKEALGIADREDRPRSLFTSRQALPPPKRRIHNFDEVAPALHASGVSIVSLGTLPAREQAEMFHNADLVIGAHGSDLSNLLFCRPGTRVLVLESALSVEANHHIGLKHLCEVLGLDYHLMITATDPGPFAPTSRAWDNRINRDYLVDAQALSDRIAGLRPPSRDRA